MLPIFIAIAGCKCSLSQELLYSSKCISYAHWQRISLYRRSNRRCSLAGRHLGSKLPSINFRAWNHLIDSAFSCPRVLLEESLCRRTLCYSKPVSCRRTLCYSKPVSCHRSRAALQPPAYLVPTIPSRSQDVGGIC